MSNESCSTEPCCSDTSNKLALVYGALILRLWLAVRAIQTGIEKYAGTIASDKVITVDGAPSEHGLTAPGAVKEYALSHYHGVPEGMLKMFEKEPLMLGFALKMYNIVLGPALLVLGLTILLGIANRTSLFLLGLLYISLTWGLILLKQDEGVSWLGIHMILIVMALMLAPHNRFAILKKW